MCTTGFHLCESEPAYMWAEQKVEANDGMDDMTADGKKMSEVKINPLLLLSPSSSENKEEDISRLPSCKVI